MYWDLKTLPSVKALKAKWRDRPIVFSFELLALSAYRYAPLETIYWVEDYISKNFNSNYLADIAPSTPYLAIRNGRRSVVERLVSRGLSFKDLDMSSACRFDNLRLLNRLSELGCHLGPRAWLCAVASKSTAVLDFLQRKDCPVFHCTLPIFLKIIFNLLIYVFSEDFFGKESVLVR
jgi:hypothetical protein